MLPIAALLASLLALATSAQSDADAAQQMINDPNPAHFVVYGTARPPKSIVDDAVQGGRALPIAVTGNGAPYAVSVNVPLTRAIKKGDHLTIMFYARLDQPGPGVSTAPVIGQLQLSAAPYTALFSDKVDVPTSWKLFQISGVADRNYDQGSVNAAFHVNTGHHTMVMGLVAVFDKGQ